MHDQVVKDGSQRDCGGITTSEPEGILACFAPFFMKMQSLQVVHEMVHEIAVRHVSW
jgi:hypothetical protein